MRAQELLLWQLRHTLKRLSFSYVAPSRAFRLLSSSALWVVKVFLVSCGRSVEMLMLAGHTQCVIVEAGDDLPSPAEIQQSYFKLWTLSLCLAGEKWVSPQAPSQKHLLRKGEENRDLGAWPSSNHRARGASDRPLSRICSTSGVHID